MQGNAYEPWHGTTILTVRKGGKVVIAGDGQVTVGQTVIKQNAKKVRPIGKGGVIGGFAGATADAFTLFERLEAKLEQYPGQLTRACVELAKDWRTDRYLRRLEAMMLVADKSTSLVLPAPRRARARARRRRHRLRQQLRAAAARALSKPTWTPRPSPPRWPSPPTFVCTNEHITVESLPSDFRTGRAETTFRRVIVADSPSSSARRRQACRTLRNRWRRQ
jgi:hypothetical protein